MVLVKLDHDLDNPYCNLSVCGAAADGVGGRSRSIGT
jgi:hypothetical protein